MWCSFWKNEIFESSCEQNSPENEDLEKVNMQWMWSTLWEKTFHKGLLVGSDSRKNSCLKIIPTRPLRHVWPEVVMENHTHTPAVHGKSHSFTWISTDPGIVFGKYNQKKLIYWRKYLIKVSQQPQKPLSRSNQIWATAPL